MTTFEFRSLTFVMSLAALVVASSSAGAQPTDKHKAHAHQFAAVSWTATALVPSPAAVPPHEIDGLGRNADDCVKYGCIDH
jgi:hypothetical protein